MKNTMKLLRNCLASLLVLLILTPQASALSPYRLRRFPKLPFTDSEINTITNVANGEVGGICGSARITYADGTQITADACLLHKIHARVVINQVQSDMFPSTVSGCVRQCWSTAYDGTSWRSSDQWQHCRGDVITALVTDINVPSNVYAATCDPRFAEKYAGFYLWARVDWDTGWCSGKFYYYAYDAKEN